MCPSAQCITDDLRRVVQQAASLKNLEYKRLHPAMLLSPI